MKKLLLIAALLLTVTTAAVACTTQDTSGTETTAGDATVADTTAAEDPADTDGEDTTVADDGEETTVAGGEEETTVAGGEEETTVAGGEDETDPPAETLPENPGVGTAAQSITSMSWDTIFKNDENTFAQEDGGAAAKFTANPFKLDDTWTAILLRGWAGSGDTENKFAKFAYRVDLGEIVVDENAYREAEQPVVDAGGDARFCISIPADALKGGFHYVRVYGICADGTAVEILNMWIEGRDLTAIEAAQAWDADKSVVTHLSFDELRKNDGTDGFFAPGALAQDPAAWDNIAKIDDTITSIKFWGWIGIAADTVGTFGYSIDGAAPIFNAAWNFETEQGVIDAAATTGAASASRMLIDIPVAGLYGDHTVVVYYMAADGSAACILKEFTVSGPAVLDTAEAGLHNNHLQIDGESADNYSASISGWMGFDEFTPAALGWAIDGGSITWDGSINVNCEDAIKLDANAGANGFRYTLKASLAGIEFGDHVVTFYALLPEGDICLLYTKDVTTKDPSAVGNSTVNYDSAIDADLASVFTYKAGLFWDGKTDGATYKINGINQLTKTMDGTFVMTVKNLYSADHMSTLIFRGNPNPDFSDPNYYGNANGDIGCAGVYVSLIDNTGVPTLRINVRGVDDAGAAVQNVYMVAMNSRDLKIVDDNKALSFYEGDTLLATVALSGNDAGYATEAVVTLADGTTDTLTDVCAAATAASDIGFAARYGSSDVVGLTFDAVTLTGLPE